jgi:hypothetical protein
MVFRLNEQQENGKQGEGKIDSKCGEGTAIPGWASSVPLEDYRLMSPLGCHSELPSVVDKFHFIFLPYKGHGPPVSHHIESFSVDSTIFCIFLGSPARNCP